MSIRFHWLFCIFLVLSNGAEARLVALPFGDGMVLQQGCPVPVWGQSVSGETVTVSFAGQNVSTNADANGRWRVDLAPLVASCEGRTLIVSSYDRMTARFTERQILRDVLVGEVWLCSGQSNMEMSLAEGRTRYGDGIGSMIAQVTDKPLVRYARAPMGGGWNRLTPEFLTSGWRSALPVYYALELHDKLCVPVGVVVAASGGSSIDSWNPANGKDAKLHLERIVPLGPFALRGALWYQGETNVKEYGEYPKKLASLHAGWKAQFENPSLPIDVVQLAPYRYSTSEELAALPHFMECQAKYAAQCPDATITVINDIGNIDDIHPNNKWLVAKRLALHAFRRDYGFASVEDNSPTVALAMVVATNRVRVVFNHAKSLYVCQRNPRMTRFAAFELAGADGIWRPADIVNFPQLDWTRQGVLTNNVIELVSKDVLKPVQVRHAYVEPFMGCLYNQVNLPCGPFCCNLTQRERTLSGCLRRVVGSSRDRGR